LIFLKEVLDIPPGACISHNVSNIECFSAGIKNRLVNNQKPKWAAGLQRRPFWESFLGTCTFDGFYLSFYWNLLFDLHAFKWQGAKHTHSNTLCHL